jgi:hypothetical protein
VRWVDVPDPNDPHTYDSGYFERVVGGKVVSCPVSIRRGQPLVPSMVTHIYGRLLLSDDPFEL